jgi:hypothetical protein
VDRADQGRRAGSGAAVAAATANDSHRRYHRFTHTTADRHDHAA